ncbi:MAG: hypothetical protein K2Q25_11460, partial [Mycobacteriaceae bacterium]|nr:hypothetical protein [Mycobacteriaceae bacterium]
TGVFVAMQATWLLNGYEKPVHPNTGSEFHQGQHTFSTDIAGTLKDAAATEWFGPAATEYQRANTAQMEHVNTVAKADQRVTRILADQADTVQKADRELTDIEIFFGTLLPIEAGLLVISWMPGMRAHAYALMVLVLVMMVSLYAAAVIIVLSVSRGGKKTERDLRAVIDDYQSAAQGAAKMLANSAVPTVAVPTAPSISSLVGKSSATPGKLDAASLASGVLDEHAAAVAQANQLFTVGQAAGISGRVSQYAQLGAHGTGPVKQPPAKADSSPVTDEQSPETMPADELGATAPAEAIAEHAELPGAAPTVAPALSSGNLA